MKNIKTYEDFCNENLTNEEINIKKALAGAALGAGLAFGSPAVGQTKQSKADKFFGWGEQPQQTTQAHDTAFKAKSGETNIYTDRLGKESQEEVKIPGKSIGKGDVNFKSVSINGKYDVFEKDMKMKGFATITTSKITNQIPSNMKMLRGEYLGKMCEVHTMISNENDVLTVAIINETPIDKPQISTTQDNPQIPNTTKVMVNYNDSIKFLFESYNKLSKDKEKIVLNLGKFHKQYKQGLITNLTGIAIELIGCGMFMNNSLNPDKVATSTYNSKTGVTTTTGGGQKSNVFPTVLMIAGGLTATVGGVIMIDSHRHLKAFDKSKMGDYEFR